ncbi:MAG: DUF4837 family protein [Bacteroidales bacterium]|nr:DUF4837 family protein [Bacteroidales bacterium]
MNNKFLNYLIFSTLFISIFFSSCKDSMESLKPNITGKPGSVLIVINQNHWDTGIGETFDKYLKEAQKGLPQAEPLFEVSRINVNSFKSNLRTHRNIIMTKISPDQQKPEIDIKRDVWAKQQFVITILAPDVQSFNKLLNEKGLVIVELLNKAEKDRLIETYVKYQDGEIRSKLQKKHNLSLAVPKGYTYFQDTANFVWIKRRNNQDVRQAILVYYFNYTDTNTFTPNYLINKRDYFLKRFLPGYHPGTYMATQKLDSVYFKEFMNNGRYTAELRGRWTIVNDYMGGPFVSFTQLDEKRNRVVTVEGHVYAPNEDKQKFLREVEAVLWTLQFLD